MAHLSTRLTVYRPGSSTPESRLYPTAWSASFVHNNPGDGSMDLEIAKQVPGERLDRGSQWLLTDAEVAVEVNAVAPGSDDGFREVRNGRFIVLKSSRDLITKSSGAIRSTLQPYAFLLSKARVWTGPSAGKGVDPGKRRFTGTIGAIWDQLMSEAAVRNALSTIRCNVSATLDSAGRNWSGTTTQVLDIGTDYLTLLNQFVSAGHFDAYFQGTELVLLRPDSDAVTQDPPVLSAGVELLSAPRDVDGTNLATHAITLGDGGVAVTATSSALPTTSWGRWETSLSVSGVTDKTVIQNRGVTTLNLYASDRVTTSAELSLHPDGVLPFRDFDVGEWVQIQVADGPAEVYQATSIALQQTQTGPLTGSLELGRRRVIPERKMVAKLNQLSAGVATDVGAGRLAAASMSSSGWLDYTPEWLGTSTGTATIPLGNGTLLGRYWVDGTTVHFRVELTFGSTTPIPPTPGQWYFTLPVDANTTLRQYVPVWLFDGGFSWTGLAVVHANGTKISPAVYAKDTEGRLSTITPTVPFTWATGDQCHIQGTYEAAVQ